MRYDSATPEEYISEIPEERKPAFNQLRKTILENLPDGFTEVMTYGMIGYAVPHSIYPSGYHCNPRMPLPFINIASQKNFIAVYHMGLYANKELMDWFIKEYKKEHKGKPEMGKSCLRFKNMDKIPFELIGKLAAKMSPKEWISIYESQFKK